MDEMECKSIFILHRIGFKSKSNQKSTITKLNTLLSSLLYERADVSAVHRGM